MGRRSYHNRLAFRHRLPVGFKLGARERLPGFDIQIRREHIEGPGWSAGERATIV
jgi:hypothetical protein